MVANEKDTSANQQRYRSVLKSSSIIGGSAFISIVIGMIRTKFVAVLLGPAGVGLMSMYTAMLAPVTTASNLGINASGVRAIAEASGQDDFNRIALVVKTLRLSVWFSGFFGCLITVALSSWLSSITFQNTDHAFSVAFLGITVLFANISIGQTCVLQGTRRILSVAKISVFGAVNGTVVSIPCFYLWGEAGIVPSLILTSFFALLTSWWFARKVVIADIEVSWAHAIAEAKKLLGFGLPIMATALQGVCVAYFLRLIIANQFGLAGVGVWSAAFAVSGILVNFVLNAMGTDYYPRLASVALNNALIEKEVNAQLEIALLLALPALLATVLFAPIGIELLYSGKFNDAIPILRWSVYGIFGRVISWPLSYIIIAQGRGKFFCAAELLANLAHVLLIYTCSKLWGLPGTGIGFMILYIYYFVFMVVTAHFIAKTHFSLGNLKLILNSIFLLVFASCMHIFIQNHFVYYANSFALSLVVIWVVLRRISRLTGVTLNGFKARFKR